MRTNKTKNLRLLAFPFACLILANANNALANSVFVGFSQSELTSVLGPREVELEPSGTSLLASFDLSDNWTVSLDIGQQDDSATFETNATAYFDNDSWGTSINYYYENWAFSYGFSNWEDELEVIAFPLRNPADRRQIYFQTNDSPSHAFRATYYWQSDFWQVGLSGGIHYSDWEQFTHFDNPLDATPRQDARDKGDSTFISLGLSASRFIPIDGNRNVILGGSVNWNELSDNNAQAISRNGRNINQINNRNLRNRLNALVVSGSDSYGQANVYLSWDITEHWVLDLDTGVDFGGDDSTQYWSVNVGYIF